MLPISNVREPRKQYIISPLPSETGSLMFYACAPGNPSKNSEYTS